MALMINRGKRVNGQNGGHVKDLTPTQNATPRDIKEKSNTYKSNSLTLIVRKHKIPSQLKKLRCDAV